MLKEFKNFALRGNLIEIAVGLVLALAFAAVVAALVEFIVMPIVGIIFGKPDFDQALVLTLNESHIRFGSFIQAIVVFLATAAGLFFLVVKPVNAVKERFEKGEEEAPAPADDIVLLTEIRDALRK